MQAKYVPQIFLYWKQVGAICQLEKWKCIGCIRCVSRTTTALHLFRGLRPVEEKICRMRGREWRLHAVGASAVFWGCWGDRHGTKKRMHCVTTSKWWGTFVEEEYLLRKLCSDEFIYVESQSDINVEVLKAQVCYRKLSQKRVVMLWHDKVLSTFFHAPPRKGELTFHMCSDKLNWKGLISACFSTSA